MSTNPKLWRLFLVVNMVFQLCIITVVDGVITYFCVTKNVKYTGGDLAGKIFDHSLPETSCAHTCITLCLSEFPSANVWQFIYSNKQCFCKQIEHAVESKSSENVESGFLKPVTDVSACQQHIAMDIDTTPPWSYSGPTGPDYWKDMEGYHECGLYRQSPIDLKAASQIQFSDPLSFTGYHQIPASMTMKNNGHDVTWTFNLPTTPTVSGGGLPGSYNFHHIRVHWGSVSTRGSAHTVNGKMFPAEMDMVHYNSRYADFGSAVASGEWDALAVVGFFFKISTADNPAFDEIVEILQHIRPADSEFTLRSAITVDSHFVDLHSPFYRYNGSLTTPACNQIVVWTVMHIPVGISESQIQAFRELDDSHHHKMVDNYRPVQPLYGRHIYTTV